MTRDVAGPREAAVAALSHSGVHSQLVEDQVAYLDANPAAKAALAAWLVPVPPLSERESADGHHMPRPSDICSVCGNGLVHIDSWRDAEAATEPPAGVTSEAADIIEEALRRRPPGQGKGQAVLDALRATGYTLTPSTSTETPTPDCTCGPYAPCPLHDEGAETPTRVVGGGEPQYGPCPTRGTDNPSARPWRYGHAASIEGLHWDIYAGEGIDGWLVGSVGNEADAALIVAIVNAATTPVPSVSDEGLRERLAALEHEQWVEWSRDLAAKEPLLSGNRMVRWQAYWVPYAELDEDVKDHDRKWADKVLRALSSEPVR